jgi:hypothetical protein
MTLAFYATLLTLHRARLAHLREHPDQGSVTLEKVVITAILVAAAVSVGLILRNLAEGKANSIDTGG